MSSHRQSYLPAPLALAVSAFAIGTTEFISVESAAAYISRSAYTCDNGGTYRFHVCSGRDIRRAGFNVSHIRHVAENGWRSG